MTSITIPNGVKSIGGGAFAVCESLTSVTIPASVTSIGVDAFEECTSFTDIYYGGSKEDWNKVEILVDIDGCIFRAVVHYNCIIPTPASAITLDNTALSVNKGETAKLTATVTPADSTDTVV